MKIRLSTLKSIYALYRVYEIDKELMAIGRDMHDRQHMAHLFNENETRKNLLEEQAKLQKWVKS